MTGKITYVPSSHERHGCEGMPAADALPAGTIWTCDDCGQEWVVVEGAQYNESYSAWRKLTERNRGGRDE